MRERRSAWALCAMLAAAAWSTGGACGGGTNPTSPTSPTGPGGGTVVATPTPAPVSLPVTTGGTPPSITLSAARVSCHPTPSTPCSIALVATASDPSGGAVSVSWGGCAAGSSGLSATCVVRALGSVTADVTATNTAGLTASQSVSLTGTNSAPTVTVSGGASCQASCSSPVSAAASDADGDPVPGSAITWSGCASGTGTSSECSMPSSGTYTATATVSDDWASGSSSRSVVATKANSRPDVGAGGDCGGTYPMFKNLTLTFPWSDEDPKPASCSIISFTGAADLPATPSQTDCGNGGASYSANSGEGCGPAGTICARLLRVSMCDSGGLCDTGRCGFSSISE